MSLVFSSAKDRVDETSRLCGPQDRRHQVAAFALELLAGHGIFDGSQHRARVLSQPPAVGEGDFQKRQPSNVAASAAAASTGRFQAYFRSKTENRRVLHTRLVVDGSERRGLIDQHQRHGVLNVDVRRIAVVDDRSRR
jgi:hypothetical protein